MSFQIQEQKQTLRKEMLKLRRNMTVEQRFAADEKIMQGVCSHPLYQKCRQVFAYVSMPHEINTYPLLERILKDGKQLGLPVCDTKKHEMQFYRLDALAELQDGAYHIPVPPISEERLMTANQDTLMIVPMLAYDSEGYRLGAGGGYYDRFLSSCQLHTIGICYAECRQEHLPHDAYDKTLLFCVTEQVTEDFYVR
ncbi:MAG: 5-formyltetrahydrofolate cyclo-ligase [Oscillospiraceae bacterium]|nr:5-formyltetrahydrofolate cyclo-ligase [Oscillospiraceae bacterium]